MKDERARRSDYDIRAKENFNSADNRSRRADDRSSAAFLAIIARLLGADRFAATLRSTAPRSVRSSSRAFGLARDAITRAIPALALRAIRFANVLASARPHPLGWCSACRRFRPSRATTV